MPTPTSASIPDGHDPVEMSITAYATAPSIRLNVAVKLKGFFPPGPLQASEISAVAVEHGARFRPAPDWRPMTKDEIVRYNRQEAAERAEVVALALAQAQVITASELKRDAQEQLLIDALAHEELKIPAVVIEPSTGPVIIPIVD